MEKIEAELIESFILLNRYLQEKMIRYCLIGGIAAGYWGEPRYTRDMDFEVVSRSHGLLPLSEQLQRDGFKIISKGESQIQVVQSGRLRFQADLILAETDYQDWVVQRALKITLFDTQVPICTAEDLIILKLIANRRQDLLDIENILKRQKSHLDEVYLKKWFDFWELRERFEKEFGQEFKIT